MRVSRRRVLAGLVGAALTATVVAGCGGGSIEPGTAPSTVPDTAPGTVVVPSWVDQPCPVEGEVAPSTVEPDGAYYSSCAQARDAGVAPLSRGEPGYRSGLDRNGDGVACE